MSRPWNQQNLDPAFATTIFACSFGDVGWHHIRKTLLEVDTNPHFNGANSTLARFLQEFCPTSISTLAGVNDEEPLPLFVYPWGTFNHGAATTIKSPLTSRFCGPSSKKFISKEISRTVALYQQMRQTGYTPQKFPNSYIAGTWLKALNGDQRFVVMQGNHRMAVLAHLRVRQISVRTTSTCLRHVRECDLANWPLVASGRCSVEHAHKVFSLFFEQTGWHVAKQMGFEHDG